MKASSDQLGICLNRIREGKVRPAQLLDQLLAELLVANVGEAHWIAGVVPACLTRCDDSRALAI